LLSAISPASAKSINDTSPIAVGPFKAITRTSVCPDDFDASAAFFAAPHPDINTIPSINAISNFTDFFIIVLRLPSN
jgi:hypothetical protein